MMFVSAHAELAEKNGGFLRNGRPIPLGARPCMGSFLVNVHQPFDQILPFIVRPLTRPTHHCRNRLVLAGSVCGPQADDFHPLLIDTDNVPHDLAGFRPWPGDALF